MIKEIWTRLLKHFGLANNDDEAPVRVIKIGREPRSPAEVFRDPPSFSKPTLKPRVKEDRDAPNLFVGKVLDDSSIKCEVISCTEEDFRIKILNIYWDRLGTYMDLGCTYPLKLCYKSGNDEMLVWEVDPDTMKRSTSQVLLAWEKDLGWSWDLDM